MTLLRRLRRYILLLLAAVFGPPVLLVLWLSMAPHVEAIIYPPVYSLQFNSYECDDDDVVASGWLNKSYGRLETITFYSVSEKNYLRQLEWEKIDSSKNSPISSSSGLQSIIVRLLDACGVDFILRTAYRTSHGLWEIPQQWGPFGPNGVAGPWYGTVLALIMIASTFVIWLFRGKR